MIIKAQNMNWIYFSQIINKLDAWRCVWPTNRYNEFTRKLLQISCTRGIGAKIMSASTFCVSIVSCQIAVTNFSPISGSGPITAPAYGYLEQSVISRLILIMQASYIPRHQSFKSSDNAIIDQNQRYTTE